MEEIHTAANHHEIVNWRFSQKCEKKAQYLFCSGYDDMRL